MKLFRSDLPLPGEEKAGSSASCAAEIRRSVYAGDVFLAPGTVEARALAKDAWQVLESRFEDAGGPALAQHSLTPEAYFERVSELRRLFFGDPHWQRAMGRVAEARGFDLDALRFDPLRLRVVMSGGHENPAAAPVYAAHRDTWYAHPASLITWWIPLHAASADETFVFYPDCLTRAVPNDSETFDYGYWIKDGPDLKIGWQDIKAGRTETFPALLHEPDAPLGPERGFSCQAGDELIFAGSHLHRTRGHDSGRTRYSFDFRLIDLSDESAGAPSVDNRSRGAAQDHYVAIAT